MVYNLVYLFEDNQAVLNSSGFWIGYRENTLRGEIVKEAFAIEWFIAIRFFRSLFQSHNSIKFINMKKPFLFLIDSQFNIY